MYFNNCVHVKLGWGFTAPLWFTRGVKQRCNLSLLLFALFIAGLGVKLQELKLAIQMGSKTITSIFHRRPHGIKKKDSRDNRMRQSDKEL